MIIGANIKEALSSLMSSKQRTLLALIGIVIGIGSVIAMVSVGHIVQVESLRQFKEMGTDLISIEKDDGSDSSSPGIGGARATKSSIKLADVLGMTAGCSAITVVAPSVNVSGQASYGGKNIPNSRLMGVTESFRDINKLRISQGRFISDLDAQSQFCVIGSNVATAIRKQGCGNIIGEKLKVGEKVYTNDYRLIENLFRGWNNLWDDDVEGVHVENRIYEVNFDAIEFISHNLQSRIGDSCKFNFEFVKTFMESLCDYHAKRLHEIIMKGKEPQS